MSLHLIFAVDEPKCLVSVEVVCYTDFVVTWERWEIIVLLLELVHSRGICVLVVAT